MDNDLRARALTLISQELHGDPNEQNSGGFTNTVISGACKDYAVYRDACGYIRGLTTAAALIDQAYRELYAPPVPVDGAPKPPDLEVK